jgi:hypothetical protein
VPEWQEDNWQPYGEIGDQWRIDIKNGRFINQPATNQSKSWTIKHIRFWTTEVSGNSQLLKVLLSLQ